MNPALSPRTLPRSQGMAVSKKVIDDPMAPDVTELEATDDIFERPLHNHVATERTLETNRALHAEDDIEGAQTASNGSGFAALLSPFSWLTDRLMASDARVRINGGIKAIYSLAVRSVMGARAQMESYSPPTKGEFSHKLPLKWGILRPTPLLRGQFLIVPAPGLAGRAGEYTIGLRARLPILPVLPWILLAAVPAIVPVLINLIIGFSWHGPALAAGWVAITGLPMFMSYISTAKRATRIFTTGIMSGLTEEALAASQTDRSSMIALVPARPTLTDQEEEALEAVMPTMLRPAAAKPVAQPVAIAPKAEPIAAARPIIPAEPVSALLKSFKPKPAEPRKAMTMDAQALVKAQMAMQVQAQLEAQLEALNKAEIELKATPKPVKPQPVETASTVSSARVRSRIKKFRTRYDVVSKPVPAEVAPEPQTSNPASQGLKFKV